VKTFSVKALISLMCALENWPNPRSRVNPKVTVKMMATQYAKVPAMAEGLRKAGMPEQ